MNHLRIKKFFSTFLLIALISTLLVGCSTPSLNVLSNLDPGFNAANYSTVSVTSLSVEQTPLNEAIKLQFEATLSEKGYRVVDTEASLIMVYDLKLSQDTQLKREVVNIGGRFIERPRIDALYTASILVNAYDSFASKVIWKAASSRDLRNVNLTEIDKDKLRARIGELFESLPNAQ